jgi:hypothetical protein
MALLVNVSSLEVYANDDIKNVKKGGVVITDWNIGGDDVEGHAGVVIEYYDKTKNFIVGAHKDGVRYDSLQSHLGGDKHLGYFRVNSSNYTNTNRENIVKAAEKAIGMDYEFLNLYIYDFDLKHKNNIPYSVSVVPTDFRCDGVAEWVTEVSINDGTASVADGFYMNNSSTNQPTNIIGNGFPDKISPPNKPRLSLNKNIVSISWDKPSGAKDGIKYKIYWGFSENLGSQSNVKCVSETNASIPVESNNKYYLKIKAGENTASCNDNFLSSNWSEFSEYAQITTNSLPSSNFWTGNASIISYHGKNLANKHDGEFPYAITQDVSVLHSKKGKKPVGFFQWQFDNSCKSLRIDAEKLSNSNKKVDITVGRWKTRNNDKTFKNVTLPFVVGESNLNDSYLNNGDWLVVSVAFNGTVSSSSRLNAHCTSEANTNKSYNNSEALIVDGYKWNGNGSIISRMFSDKVNSGSGKDWPYGAFQDVSKVHPSSYKPVVFFQWMSSDMCDKLTIDAPNLLSNQKKVKLHVKGWDKGSGEIKNVTLPYTLNSNNQLWSVISVAFDKPVNRESRVTAKCPGY